MIAGVVGLVIGGVLLGFVSSPEPVWNHFAGVRRSAGGTGWGVLLQSVVAAFFSRTGRYGVNTVVMVAAFIGLVVLINYVAFENHVRADTTATNQFSLSDRTRDLLDNLDQPITVIAYYPDEISDIDVLTRRGKVETTLSEFSKRNTNFAYRFQDPQKEPDLARGQGVTSYETLSVLALTPGPLIYQPDRPGRSAGLEQDLYTALLVATGTERKKVYFLAGHGERGCF